VKEYDLNRQAEIENLGITLIRFTNEEVLNSLSGVLHVIKEKVKELHNAQIPKTT